MRLIDADAITEDERQEHGFFYNSDLQELLDEQPTIDISNTSNTLGALDCVSRQDAIKFFTELWECIGNIGDREEWEDVCVTTVNEIKSAQPENKELLAWQEDFQGYIKMLNLPRDDYKGIMEYINEVPPAQPRNGKWIFIHPLQADDEGAYICSNCHRGDWDIKPTDKYCKFCGMAMDIYATLLP